MSSVDQARRRVLVLAAIAAPTLAWGAPSSTPRLQGVWTADGQFRFFSAPDGIRWESSDGASRGQLLPLGLSFTLTPGSVSPVTGHLAYTALDRRTGSTIWTVPVQMHDVPVAGEPVVFFPSRTFDLHPHFSTDGRRIAYESRAAGQSDFYVRSFPDTGHFERTPRFNP